MNCPIKVFPQLITKTEAQDIIEYYDKNLVKAKTVGKSKGEMSRVANMTLIKEKNGLVSKIQENIAEITKTPIKNQENPNFIKYEIDGTFKAHYDFLQDLDKTLVENGGDRMYTALLYLNEGYIGGETEFPKWGIKMKLKAGSLVVWKNLKDNGVPNKNSLHAGLPVKAGTKKIMVIWVREGEYITKH